MKISEDRLAEAAALLDAVPSVDVHSHPGRFFMRGPGAETPFALSHGEPFPERSIAQMQQGRVSAVLFAAVADHLILDRSPLGLRTTRDYAPGEVFGDYHRQLAVMRAIVGEGGVDQGVDSGDIRSAHAARRTACIFSVEGGDFFEDRLERVQESWDAGVRSVTIIHYHVNQIGDTQTSPPVHGGLTPLGRAIVKEMNRVGQLIDLTHASFEATRDAAEASTRPMILSHSNLRAPGLDHPRLISLDHARLVTRHGGLVGALPAGAGAETFEDYIDNILRMVDLLGLDCVAIGTDMDFTFRSVLDDYADWNRIPAGLLAKGMAREEVAKIIGGNFMRLLDAVQPARAPSPT